MNTDAACLEKTNHDFIQIVENDLVQDVVPAIVGQYIHKILGHISRDCCPLSILTVATLAFRRWLM